MTERERRDRLAEVLADVNEEIRWSVGDQLRAYVEQGAFLVFDADGEEIADGDGQVSTILSAIADLLQEDYDDQEEQND